MFPGALGVGCVLRPLEPGMRLTGSTRAPWPNILSANRVGERGGRFFLAQHSVLQPPRSSSLIFHKAQIRKTKGFKFSRWL